MWGEFVKKEKAAELEEIINTGFNGKPLKDEETRELIDKMFRKGSPEFSEAELADILPPISRFGGLLDQAKNVVSEILREFFAKYYE